MTGSEMATEEEEAETSPLDLGARFICEDFWCNITSWLGRLLANSDYLLATWWTTLPQIQLVLTCLNMYQLDRSVGVDTLPKRSTGRCY